MPWELSSVLSRLRGPVHPRPTPEPTFQDTPPNIQQESSPQQLQIDRKILQDPSSLLDSHVQDALPLGLTPSTRASGSSSTRHPTLQPRNEPPPGSSADISSRTQSRFTIGRISRIASGGEWSTFGRKRERRVPDAPGISHTPSPTRGSKHLSADSTLSTFTLSRLTHTSTSTHDRPSSPSTRSPDIRYSSKRSSPTNTMSSKRHPRTPQRPSSSSAANVMTLANRESALDSPHTFGHPTPPDNPVECSSPLPLPPLDHPELTAVLSLRRKFMSTDQHTLSAFRDRSNTLPTNHRTPRRDDLFPSLSLRLGRSIRHQSSLPQAKDVFNTATTRARTVSAGARQRRTSADWCSYQATVGVNSHVNQAWPAEVSREILRLSLTSPELVPGSSGKRTTATRDKNADPVRRSDRVLSPSFLPFPHPSRPNSPSPLGASATLAGALTSTSSRNRLTREYRPDNREIIPPRSRSLQFKLGNGRDSQQPASLTMAQVKRSLSAVEPRRNPNNGASGATSASFALSDPVPRSSDAPQSSLARTPSRSLFSSPVFPTNTPMSSSAQEEPSTPTPEPRHLSEKSRGKRKAEDNIDLTPPELKKEKEGQRATFLLPSESRSKSLHFWFRLRPLYRPLLKLKQGQRVSNASHAPSSYRRKRARLSSVSPFATPVQSRPASLQETPRSASHDHYFTSLSSSTGARIGPRTPSRAASTRSRQPPTPSTTRKHERGQSMSQVSIPISAYISPHAPSISKSTKFHMRDPRKPPKKPNDTSWGLQFATEDEPGSAIQAWCFFLGFLLFPTWWIAGLFLHVPTTRIAGDVDAEKGVTIDDPQIERGKPCTSLLAPRCPTVSMTDARTWRFRCRVMAVVSLFTYVPFIVLVAIFAPR